MANPLEWCRPVRKSFKWNLLSFYFPKSLGWFEEKWRGKNVFRKSSFWHGWQKNRKRAADDTYVLPPYKFPLQLSCHMVKSGEQSRNFVSCHFWTDKEVNFLFFLEALYFSACFLRLSLQGRHSCHAVFDRCGLELCTHAPQAWNKDLPPPSHHPFSLKSTTLPLTNIDAPNLNKTAPFWWRINLNIAFCQIFSPHRPRCPLVLK